MKRLASSLVVIALAAVALTGCVPAPNTAAMVNGTRITESKIDVDSVATAQALGADPNQIRGGVLQYQIWGVLARQIAAETNNPITEDQLQAVIAGGPQLAQLAANPGTQSLARDAASLIYLSTVVERNAFLARLSEAKIEVNPRYGSWSPNQMAVTGDSGSLSVPSQLG